MDLISGEAFWPIKNGLLATYPALKRDLACEVAIIGGGITGALVADSLCEAGIDCVLLDKREVGWGSTSASTALLQYEADTHLVDLIRLVGEEHAVRSYRLSLAAIETIGRLTAELGDDCGYERKQSVYLASRRWDVRGLRKECELRAKHGFQVEWLDEADVADRFSFERYGGILSHDAAQVDAYRLTHALLARAVGRGLKVYDRTAVARYERDGEQLTILTDRGARVTARTVVFAAGYEAQEYLSQKVVTLKSTYALVSEPLDTFAGWYQRCLLWETARPYVYLRTTSDNRALIGGEDEPFKNAALRDRLLSRKTERLAHTFREMFPVIDMDVAFSWGGTFGETKDGLAYIGATDEFPGAYFALGYGGNGITYSVIAAEIIRDACLGRENDDAQIFRFGR